VKALLVALLILALPATAHAGYMAKSERVADYFFPAHCEPVRYARDADMTYYAAYAHSPRLDRGWPCRVTFAPRFYRLSKLDKCVLIVHEYGHLMGLWHSSDPSALMYGPEQQQPPTTDLPERAVEKRCARSLRRPL
jgi:hypothetical protein